jgi:NADH dehydrogenase FAD-containing subunit
LQVQLEPLAKWCKADYIEQRVEKIIANENKILLKDGSYVDYDVLVVNVGSRTQGSYSIPGVWENSLTTRPINDMLGKIVKKENELLNGGVIPDVVVCGGGAAGTELAFGFKSRWSKLFNHDVKVTLVSNKDHVLQGTH